MGLLDSILDPIFGGSSASIDPSGAFQRVPEVGGAYSNLLLERLGTPPGETESFKHMEAALRESLGRVSGAQRQRLSDMAVTGGWFDSGARLQGIQDIGRGELESFASGLRDILLALENRRTSEVLPYLGLASKEHLGIEELELAKSGQQMDFLTGLLGMASERWPSQAMIDLALLGS